MFYIYIYIHIYIYIYIYNLMMKNMSAQIYTIIIALLSCNSHTIKFVLPKNTIQCFFVYSWNCATITTT